MITHPVLTKLAKEGVKLGLERVNTLLKVLGEPHLAYPVVHVAGTNGKGSVCAYVTASLVEAGYRVGTNISPHLEHVNERVQIDGVPLDDGSFEAAVESLERARRDWVEERGFGDSGLTYFEFVTLLAFRVFAEHQVGAAVVEVGMGGRLDATNVVRPAACAITSIGLDHMEELGPDLASIAGEKAGIIKRGVPVVVGPLAPAAMAVVAQRAEALGCTLWRPGQQLRRSTAGGLWSFSTPDGVVAGVKLGLQGEHQAANALVAVGVLHALRRQGFHIPDDAIVRGLGRAFMPGRVERLRPGLVVDGAHNPDGSRALAAWLATQPRPGLRLLLFGMGAGRDPKEVVAPLLPYVDEVVTTRCAHPKALDPMDLGQMLQGIPAALSAGGDVEQTLPELYAEADELIVAGSLYLAGAVRALVGAGVLDGLVPGQGLPEGDEPEYDSDDDGDDEA